MVKTVSKALRRAAPLGLTPMALSLAACGGGEDGSEINSNDENIVFSLAGNRGDYHIDSINGLYFITSSSGVTNSYDNGTVQFTDGGIYVLRDTASIIARASSHLENYAFYENLANANVSWLHTGAWWGSSDSQNVFENPEDILQYPSLGNHSVVTAYINISEITGVGGWDPHWDQSWDQNGDNLIDVPEDQLPSYLQGLDLNEYWGNYVVNYWEPEWKNIIFEKIDIVMAQNFDGVMFDVTTGWQDKVDTNPNALQDMADLIVEVTNYIHQNYGNTALSTFNMGVNVLINYPELSELVDAIYQQNSYFQWTGSGEVSESFEPNITLQMSDIMGDQNKLMFVMDHVNDPTEDNFVSYLVQSVDTNTVPMIASHLFENFEDYPIYRFSYDGSEILEGWEFQDYFWSGVGNDIFAGNGGEDVFAFSASSSGNVIVDFDPDNDKIVFLDNDLQVLDHNDLSKITTDTGDLQISSTLGATVILQGCDAGNVIDVHSSFLA